MTFRIHENPKHLLPLALLLDEMTILNNCSHRNLKPDRLVIHNNEAFLIDYKTGLPEEKHKNQIENYVRVIEKMNVKVAKKVLLYIGEELKIIHL